MVNIHPSSHCSAFIFISCGLHPAFKQLNDDIIIGPLYVLVVCYTVSDANSIFSISPAVAENGAGDGAEMCWIFIICSCEQCLPGAASMQAITTTLLSALSSGLQ